jgi:hypothetical protein
MTLCVLDASLFFDILAPIGKLLFYNYYSACRLMRSSSAEGVVNYYSILDCHR